MIKVGRIRHVSFSTPDLARLADYYRSIIGLGIVARESDRLFMATESEELAIVLEAGAEPKCRGVAFEVAGDADLAEMRADLSASGIASDIRSDSAPGVSRSLVFTDPEATEIELISGWNASPAGEPLGGITANRLGHVAMYTADPQATSKFYSEVLGFRVSDWIEQSFVFMRCGSDHHTLNFVAGEARSINHIAFELRDFIAYASGLRPARAQPDSDPVGAGQAWARPQRRGLPPQFGWPGRRTVLRSRSHDRRGARLFRAAALAPRSPATAQGLGGASARYLGIAPFSRSDGVQTKKSVS